MKKFLFLFLILFIFSCSQNNESTDFGYKDAQRDANWYLIARTDLKNANNIQDGYTSIKELFTKLNSINETQVEPLYKPIYFWENAPTFIIIGDMHADEYNLNTNDVGNLKLFFKDILTEENEESDAEINVIELLHKKFGIQTIGLENEFFDAQESMSLIGKWLKNLWIQYIGLESNDAQNNAAIGESLINLLLHSFDYYKVLGFDLNINTTEEEINTFFQNEKFKEAIKDSDYQELLNQNKNKTREEKEKILYDFFTKLYKKYENNKELDIMMLKYNLYTAEKTFWKEILNQILLEIEANPRSRTIEDNIINTSKSILDFDELIIQQRNQTGIEIISKHLDEKNIAMIVYGKAHITDLIDQLQKKYNSQVNIYVAK